MPQNYSIYDPIQPKKKTQLIQPHSWLQLSPNLLQALAFDAPNVWRQLKADHWVQASTNLLET